MGTEDHRVTQLDEDGVSLSSERERASLLASVMKHDAERKDAQAAARPLGPRPLGPQLIALAASTLLAVYVWFGSPAWLGPDPAPLPPLAEEGSAVRTAVWLGSQQVEAFRAKNGRVPGSQEVGPLPPGVSYERLDARRYILAGRGDRIGVTYAAGQPQEDLLRAVGEVLAPMEDK
jgi:hypothetical protein